MLHEWLRYCFTAFPNINFRGSISFIMGVAASILGIWAIAWYIFNAGSVQMIAVPPDSPFANEVIEPPGFFQEWKLWSPWLIVILTGLLSLRYSFNRWVKFGSESPFFVKVVKKLTSRLDDDFGEGLEIVQSLGAHDPAGLKMLREAIRQRGRHYEADFHVPSVMSTTPEELVNARQEILELAEQRVLLEKPAESGRLISGFVALHDFQAVVDLADEIMDQAGDDQAQAFQLLYNQIRLEAVAARPAVDARGESIEPALNDRITNQTDAAISLAQAADQGSLERVDLLLQRGADVNSQTGVGVTPLILAAQNGHLDVVKALLNAGADVNAQLETGETALFQAAVNGQFATVEELLSNGADPDLRIDRGQTPLDAAKSLHGHQFTQESKREVIESIIELLTDRTKSKGNLIEGREMASWISDLNDESGGADLDATVVLVKSGDLAVPQLLSSLSTQTDQACRNILYILGELGRDAIVRAGRANEFMQVVDTLCDADDPRIQVEAHCAWIRVTGKDIAAHGRAICDHLRSSDREIRSIAINALRKLGSHALPSAEKLFYVAEQDPDPEIRFIAMRVLGEIGWDPSIGAMPEIEFW